MIQEHVTPVAGKGSALLVDRCRSAETEFAGHLPAALPAVRYNDRLAAHWKPGIMTRDLALEEAEAGVFSRLLHGLLTGPPPPGRPARRPLILDLGGGTGKVVDWLESLLATHPVDLTYLYFDISARMRDEAAARFARLQDGVFGGRVHGSLTLADVTTPVFTRTDWRDLRRAFHPVVAVCAGGTIGNFGGIDAADNTAQDRVSASYFRAADAGLATFLDPNRLDRSLAAYAAFGMESGLYDGQTLSFFSGRPESGSRAHVSFHPSQFAPLARHAVRIATSLESRPFWIKLDMTKGGAPVGQVTRHYSEAYAEARFLRRTRIVERVRVSRATCITFRHGHRAGH